MDGSDLSKKKNEDCYVQYITTALRTCKPKPPALYTPITKLYQETEEVIRVTFSMEAILLI
jgi:hypothetical protein